ncbi:hypothetical protein [uncultured Polaribacter sp.]|uniref:hypothetical protein n=1 Tax=uncultured Polaribacter sp. TaxID=174711 RepID=UPI002628623B|nr:hypothetical protein [uncultured Polaribacter sp.]
MELLSDIAYLAVIITGIFTLIYRRKYNTVFYKYFLAYIIMAIVVESLGVILTSYRISNIVVYNVYTFFEFNFVALIYYTLTKEEVSHLWIKYLMIFFNGIYFLSFIFKILEKSTVLLGAMVVCVFMVFYLKELLKSDKIIRFQKDLSFWITVGFLIYYLTTMPFYTVFYIFGYDAKSEGPNLFILQSVIIIFTHICFISGIIWSSKEKN